jgi:tRNA threonylcarbamoyladenosine biosynthesis protein TsaB
MADAPGRDAGLVLGIDSCTDLLGLGLVERGAVVACATIDSRGAHSETLLPAVAALLERAGRGARAIALVGVTTGPGRFTSLRIGLATAQGLAYALDAPVVPVSALEALAVARGPAAAPVAAVLDGGGAGVFAGVYRVEGLAARAVVAPEFEDPDAFAARVKDALGALGGEAVGAGRAAPLAVAGTGAPRAAAALARAGVPCEPAPALEAGAAVARIALARSADAVDPEQLTPVYMRPTRAEERHAGSARVLDRFDAS